MAQLLVKAIDNYHSDPVKDRMCYKRGDVVAVVGDDHVWGVSEGPPAFEVISVTGAAGDYAYLLCEQTETLNDRVSRAALAIASLRHRFSKEIELAPVVRRRYHFDLDDPNHPVTDKTRP